MDETTQPKSDVAPHLSREDYITILRTIGPDQSETNIDQVRWMVKAMEIFAERQVQYGDGWADWGWKGQLVKMLDRMRRVWNVFWKNEAAIVRPSDTDDALDLINYIVFFLRLLELQEENGQVDW